MATSATDDTTHWWRPAPSPGGLIGGLGVILSLLLAGGAIAVASGLATLPVPSAVAAVAAVLLLAVAATLAYLLWGYLSIGYELGERTLVVRWAHRRDRIDLAAITRVGPATELLDEPPGRWQRFWPGYYVGARRAAIGTVRVVATLPARRQLLVTTDSDRYAISPERPVLFIEEYGRLRRALDVPGTGPAVPEPGEDAFRLAAAGWTSQPPIVLPPRPRFDDETEPDGASERCAELAAGVVESATVSGEPEAGAELRSGLLADTVAVTFLAAAVVLNLGMVGYIAARYGTIPPSIALHWNVNGLPDRIGSPREIWTLPLITALITLANSGLAWSVVRFDRFAARFLLVATCLVQLVAWVAVISLLRK